MFYYFETYCSSNFVVALLTIVFRDLTILVHTVVCDRVLLKVLESSLAPSSRNLHRILE